MDRQQIDTKEFHRIRVHGINRMDDKLENLSDGRFCMELRSEHQIYYLKLIFTVHL